MMSRRLFAALWIALCLLLGQQAAALHDLGHATEQLGGDKKPGTPSKHVCDECFFRPSSPAPWARTLRFLR
jgi:hypothetical protein